MQRHLRGVHKLETVHKRLIASRQGTSGAEGDVTGDHALTEDYTYEFVLKDLLPLRLAAKKGCQAFFSKHFRRELGGQANIKTCVKSLYGKVKREVRSKLQSAKQTNCKFALSMDTWKSKSNRSSKRCFAFLIGRWFPAIGNWRRSAWTCRR